MAEQLTLEVSFLIAQQKLGLTDVMRDRIEIDNTWPYFRVDGENAKLPLRRRDEENLRALGKFRENLTALGLSPEDTDKLFEETRKLMEIEFKEIYQIPPV